VSEILKETSILHIKTERKFHTNIRPGLSGFWV